MRERETVQSAATKTQRVLGAVAQLFNSKWNYYAKASIIGSALLAGAVLGGLGAYFRSPLYTGQHEFVDQPVQFTHEHHVAGLGIDCRYCHFSVETSAFAGIPPTKVCMNCHSQVWTEAPILEPIRESFRTDKAIRWQRVHRLADYVYFNHSAHVNKGIGCAECHGAVDRMPLISQEKSLQMAWCLECHRNPEKFVRPKDEVFNMSYQKPENQQALAAELVKSYHIQSKVSCTTCHR